MGVRKGTNSVAPVLGAGARRRCSAPVLGAGARRRCSAPVLGADQCSSTGTGGTTRAMSDDGDSMKRLLESTVEKTEAVAIKARKLAT